MPQVKHGQLACDVAVQTRRPYMTETSHDVAGALRRNHARYLGHTTAFEILYLEGRGHTHYWSVCLSVRVPVTVLVCVISMFTRCPLSHTQSLRHYLALSYGPDRL